METQAPPQRSRSSADLSPALVGKKENAPHSRDWTTPSRQVAARSSQLKLAQRCLSISATPALDSWGELGACGKTVQP
jgi:hypothetical protein